MTCHQLVALCVVLLSTVFLPAYGQDYQEEIAQYQQALNEEFRSPTDSPLPPKQRRRFKEMPFYPVAEKYRVTADLVRTPAAKPFLMQTTTSRLPTYQVYGVATFRIDGEEHQLNLYRYQKSPAGEYSDGLFLPFTDETNDDGSYGGGRFLDLKIPEGDEIVIDFNKAYNPYCAYSDRYSCPIPPPENNLATRIEAGVKH